ncbi:MAG: Arsenical pump membrane protein [Candidatus Heimdallarchaeota archaeon LC_3]|nr:MAG: Arsenical pump membrane protein [Candidatus Heimdallarchaeota archaeon LC_3]
MEGSVIADPLYILLFLGIFVFTYTLIIYSKFNKHFAAFLGGVLVLVAGWLIHFFDTSQLYESYDLTIIEHLSGDIVILAIIVANLLVVDIGGKSGLFHYIAIKILKLTKGDSKKLLLYMGLLTVVLSIVINNISAILIAGSLTILACQRLNYPARPFIIAEMILVNVAGMYTLVSSVPNIIIGTTLDIGYVDFLAIGVVVASTLILVSFVFFFIQLQLPKSTISKEEQMKVVEEFDEWASVKNIRFFYATGIILSIMIILFVLSTFIGLSVLDISLIGATAMILASGVDFDDAIKAIDWPLLAFFAGLFVLVSSLELVGVIDILADLIQSSVGTNLIIAALVILWVSAIFSGIVDNIVIAAALAPMIITIADATGMSVLVLGWALIIGANLGGDFTPIGSPSNVIGISVLAKRTGDKIGWSGWKTPALITVVHLVVASGIIVVMAVLLG